MRRLRNLAASEEHLIRRIRMHRARESAMAMARARSIRPPATMEPPHVPKHRTLDDR
jgi:hypothetical protein